MTWTLLLLAALIAVQTGQVPSHPRWAPGSRVGVWVDARQAPPDGVRMADRAVAQWHAALGGHVELVVV